MLVSGVFYFNELTVKAVEDSNKTEIMPYKLVFILHNFIFIPFSPNFHYLCTSPCKFYFGQSSVESNFLTACL